MIGNRLRQANRIARRRYGRYTTIRGEPRHIPIGKLRKSRIASMHRKHCFICGYVRYDRRAFLREQRRILATEDFKPLDAR